MVWGPMIAWYLFLAGASAGAFLTSTFVEAKYPESVKMRVAGRIIAPIFVGIGLLMLMLDAEAGLHNPLRFFWLISNPGSVMTLGVYFICVYMPVALAVAVLEILKKRVPKWLTWIGIVAAFAVAAYTGFLLGVVKAYPLWNNAILPILFVVSALSAGLAATSLVGLIVDRERFEQMWLIKTSHVILSAVEMVVLATMLIIVSAGSFEGAASVYSLVAGQYAPAFWGGIVLLGLVAPFLIEGYPVFIAKRVETSTTSMVVSVIGEAGVLVGGFMLRLLVILAALPVLFLSLTRAPRPPPGGALAAGFPLPFSSGRFSSFMGAAHSPSAQRPSVFRRIEVASMEESHVPHWGMVIDLAKCVGCDSCTVACKAENRTPPGVTYNVVLEQETGAYPNVRIEAIPRPCMQCENPACVSVCPVSATYRGDDGIVVIDADRCIGCKYCIAACPYGARSADEGSSYAVEMQAADQVTAPEYGVDHGARGKYRGTYGTVRKCTFCAHRIAEGEAPACCETCIGDARYFGDLNDPSSKVAQLAASPRAFRLREELGTNPSVYYLK